MVVKLNVLVAIIGAGLIVGLAGCSGATAPQAAHSTAPSPKPSTYYGETATAIATQISGCTDIKAGDVGKGGPDMTSTATCMLDGRAVTVNSWATADARDGVDAVLQANKVEAYYAKGEGWTVTPTDDPNLQLQLTNDAATLIANSLAGKTPPPPDIPGQRASAGMVAASLNGTVVHVQP